jgi:hypothetical protein
MVRVNEPVDVALGVSFATNLGEKVTVFEVLA